MRITFSTTAYVQATASELDMVFDLINTWANGNENLCATLEEIEEALESGELKTEAYEYLSRVSDKLKALGENVGDIVFHK